MLKKALILLTAILLTGLILFISGCCSRKKEIVTSDDFVVASSIDILQTTIDQLASDNFDLLGKYMRSGDLYVLPRGTKIRIMQMLNDKYIKCLVLDGIYVDKEFWTFALSIDYGSNIPYELIVTDIP